MTVKMQENEVGILMIKNYSLCALTYLIACSSHIHNVHMSSQSIGIYIFTSASHIPIIQPFF